MEDSNGEDSKNRTRLLLASGRGEGSKREKGRKVGKVEKRF